MAGGPSLKEIELAAKRCEEALQKLVATLNDEQKKLLRSVFNYMLIDYCTSQVFSQKALNILKE